MKGKTVIVGVTGGIAAYKACELVSKLKKSGASVHVIMTKNACEFIAPLTLETLSQNRVITDTFDRGFTYEVGHVSLAKKADILAIVPATANIIAKLNLGLCDDMLSTTLLTVTCPIVVCPAMNTNMYNNAAFRNNLQGLEQKGHIIVSPVSGRLACGDMGEGKLADIDVIFEAIANSVNSQSGKCDYVDKKVLVTAGATIENIDGVRYITNHSSGKMGFAIAAEAQRRGAAVTLVCGKTTAVPPSGVKVIEVQTTIEMYKTVLNEFTGSDILIKAAAPADYRVVNTSLNKIKSHKLTLELEKSEDIAKACGKVKENRKLVIFCAETQDLKKSALKKLKDKNADLVIANDVTQPGAGFGIDTNIVTIIDKSGNIEDLPVMPKTQLAAVILDRIKML